LIGGPSQPTEDTRHEEGRRPRAHLLGGSVAEVGKMRNEDLSDYYLRAVGVAAIWIDEGGQSREHMMPIAFDHSLSGAGKG
jgi:hypothetical protein